MTNATNQSSLIPAHKQVNPSPRKTATTPAVATQVGNTTHLGHHLGAITIQPKLTIGPVNDQYEQEANQVAQQVVNQVNTPATQRQELPEEEEEIQAKAVDNILQRQELPEDDEELQAKSVTGLLQRQEAPEEDEEELQAKPAGNRLQRQELPEEEEEMVQAKPTLQRSADGSMAATPELERELQQARGGGHSLPTETRQPMERAFGADFSRVRVHSDAQADQLNRSIEARAFTTGQDIFMRQGEYSPNNRTGQELLAHELTHVVQQNQEVTR